MPHYEFFCQDCKKLFSQPNRGDTRPLLQSVFDILVHYRSQELMRFLSHEGS